MRDIAVLAPTYRAYKGWLYNIHGYNPKNVSRITGFYTVAKSRFIPVTREEDAVGRVFVSMISLPGTSEELQKIVRKRLKK